MNASDYRAWVYRRHGLGDVKLSSPVEALVTAGWQRSVGGVSPYLGLRARCGVGRQAIDDAATRLDLFELPSARSCTYVLPSAHFELS